MLPRRIIALYGNTLHGRGPEKKRAILGQGKHQKREKLDWLEGESMREPGVLH